MSDWITPDEVKMHHSNGYAAGVVHERERIIALLERYANTECDEHCGYSCECFAKYEAQLFISLIKGENE